MAALLLVVLFHRWLPETRWLLVHLVTLGLVTNSVLVWSQHFTDSLLKNRVPDDARGRQLARIGLLNAGTVLLVVGLLTGWYVLVLVASTAVGAAVAWHGAALLRQLRTALPSRFAVTVRYYVVAAFLLPVGAVLGALLAAGPDAAWHARLLLVHEATNVLGFVGLTMRLTLSFSAATSPLASTVMERVRSPAATAVATSAMARTWVVRLSASWFTLSVRSRHSPAAPGTRACSSPTRSPTSWASWA